VRVREAAARKGVTLDIRIFDESTPISSPTQKAELFGGLFCRFPIDICD